MDDNTTPNLIVDKALGKCTIDGDTTDLVMVDRYLMKRNLKEVYDVDESVDGSSSKQKKASVEEQFGKCKFLIPNVFDYLGTICHTSSKDSRIYRKQYLDNKKMNNRLLNIMKSTPPTLDLPKSTKVPQITTGTPVVLSTQKFIPLNAHTIGNHTAYHDENSPYIGRSRQLSDITNVQTPLSVHNVTPSFWSVNQDIPLLINVTSSKHKVTEQENMMPYTGVSVLNTISPSIIDKELSNGLNKGKEKVLGLMIFNLKLGLKQTEFQKLILLEINKMKIRTKAFNPLWLLRIQISPTPLILMFNQHHIGILKYMKEAQRSEGEISLD
ncbi:hypothetical protein QVD17_19474 [Tagetes erecta]|uniref:Uncharacterized protein n=1 Tax=Tagetes erecta TaxID=13708 RepID=A0AAD8NQ34_TARER|nr:hypothetical protein QVD17_19474 [Tagetes erecta]